ncbi:hypothetical protein IMG5_065850 [Ichthyophthirius multifiliis]|uniref:Deoxyhypusine monooxygenase n=1 Tax=Ichthyophthirius multifiliis TaxID=5932 RepID=G0QPA1_ICHMU|nr:hypothetical protein IMG5_065850 [Ichthyophthirius multifiliis]EGR32956.1 hypothetical protein IMG5_065850 [Ichthyophthirius multifiliis]|eukprot:XP_004036942.1 hypothetical protein IMG5_065850 [Ichthyophthirius multifiliis]
MQLVDNPVNKFSNILQNPESDVIKKYISIFELKSLNTSQSVQALIDNFENLDNSDLLKHEVTYALGQMNTDFKYLIKPFLVKVLDTENEYPVVRHEAAEGLSNFCEEDSELLQLFQKYSESNINEKKYGLQFAGTREPAAPFEIEEIQSVKLLSELLNRKYWEKTNNLFRHEICFVLGQISKNANESIMQLKETSADQEENEIVRHEALSAYSSIADDKEFLKLFVNDPSRIVRESAVVAVGLIDYWNNK